MRLATFDIFDTTLIRRCGRPEVVRHLLAQRLYPTDTAAREAFAHWRAQARGETIAEMYAGLVERDFPEYTRQQLIDAELAVEAEQLTVNPAVRDIIDARRAEGCTIAFVSDMYLPSEWLAGVLEREGCIKAAEQVYVSCEHGARKDTGTLYDVVRRELSPTQWHHYGDNLRSDVRMARRHGVNAHRVDTSFTAVEQRLIDSSAAYRDSWKLKALAGLQRATRIDLGNTPEAILAADFVAPTYIPYVLSTNYELRITNDVGTNYELRITNDLGTNYELRSTNDVGTNYEVRNTNDVGTNYELRSTNNLGTNYEVRSTSSATPQHLNTLTPYKRLVFLSRDGYIMQQIALAMAPEGVELGYLFVSRRSLMRPYLAGGDVRAKFLTVVDKNTLLRKHVDELLGKLSLTRSLLQEQYGITFNYSQIVTRQQQDDFLEKVFGNEALVRDFQADCQRQRALLLDYFRQEGITDGGVALVDVGWLGTSRLMINSILAESGYPPVFTYYLGTRGDVYPPAYGAYWSYFPQGSLDTSNTALIESYFSASPWPSTIGYVRNGDKVEPLFVNGTEYRETAVVKANVEAARYIACRIGDIAPSQEMLYDWARLSLGWLSSIKSRIDLAPLARTADMGGDSGLVTRLGLKQTFAVVFTGKHCTDFDRGSLIYTLGYRMGRLAIPLAAFTGRLRSFLFRRLIRN